MDHLAFHIMVVFFKRSNLKAVKVQSGLKMVLSNLDNSSSHRWPNFSASGCNPHSTCTHPSAVTKSFARNTLSAISRAVSRSICWDTDSAQATFPTSKGFNVLKCSRTARAKATKSSSSFHWSIANAHSTHPKSWAHMYFKRCFGPWSISCAASFIRSTSLHQTLAKDQSNCDKSKLSNSAILPRACCATAAKRPSWQSVWFAKVQSRFASSCVLKDSSFGMADSAPASKKDRNMPILPCIRENAHSMFVICCEDTTEDAVESEKTSGHRATSSKRAWLGKRDWEKDHRMLLRFCPLSSSPDCNSWMALRAATKNKRRCTWRQTAKPHSRFPSDWPSNSGSRGMAASASGRNKPWKSSPRSFRILHRRRDAKAQAVIAKCRGCTWSSALNLNMSARWWLIKTKISNVRRTNSVALSFLDHQRANRWRAVVALTMSRFLCTKPSSTNVKKSEIPPSSSALIKAKCGAGSLLSLSLLWPGLGTRLP